MYTILSQPQRFGQPSSPVTLCTFSTGDRCCISVSDASCDWKTAPHGMRGMVGDRTSKSGASKLQAAVQYRSSSTLDRCAESRPPTRRRLTVRSTIHVIRWHCDGYAVSTREGANALQAQRVDQEIRAELADVGQRDYGLCDIVVEQRDRSERTGLATRVGAEVQLTSLGRHARGSG